MPRPPVLRRPALRLRRPPLRLLLALAALGALLAGGWMWLRESSLARVQDVEITGVSGPQAETIRSALRTAARDLSTLHVRTEVLVAAAAPYPAIARIDATADFPHTLHVEVVQRRAIATLAGPDGAPVPVAADGTLLRGAAEQQGPELSVPSAPAGTRVDDRATLRTLAALAAAPPLLRAKVTSAFHGSTGLTLRLRNGPTVRFGADDRLRAKWASLTTVLSSGQARGATAIDVRVPERPAAAGLEQGAAQIGPSTPG